MESNWRLNIALAGWAGPTGELQDTDMILCARLLLPDPIGVLIVETEGDNEFGQFSLWSYEEPLGSNLPGRFAALDKPAAHPHFPYGLPVEPD